MKFGLVDRQGYVPDMNYGSTGQELSCFVPSDYTFEQVSYDNGEGSVKVDDHVWRFFFTHEANPMAMLIEQAGGKAFTHTQRILDIAPDGIHQRVAVVLGAANEVDNCLSY